MVVEPMKVVPTDQVRSWANQLAGEARGPDWLHYSYVVPDVLQDIALELVHTRRGLIGLVGQQGVGKSSALMALHRGVPFSLSSSRILFKWRREKDLFTTLLNNTHEASEDFMPKYLSALVNEIEARFSTISVRDGEMLRRFKKRVEGNVVYIEIQPESSVILWAEAKVGKAATQRIRQDTWRDVLRKETILIDTPDYPKADKRRMDADLQDIYWFWNNLLSEGSAATIVVAIQKEMFRDHYFLDKMQRFELRPLRPGQMVEAYRLRFETTYPFSEDALLTVARLSRGIFRRFMRYIVLTLDFWQRPNHPDVIDEEAVKRAVPPERLAEDMALEFVGLFPKHSELRMLAVRLIFYLQEHGPEKQSQLSTELDIESSAMSRLLGKLESSKHITRSREGVDKIVALRE